MGAPDMETYLFTGADGKEYGPVSRDQILAWKAQGRLTETSMIKVASNGQTVPVSSLLVSPRSGPKNKALPWLIAGLLLLVVGVLSVPVFGMLWAGFHQVDRALLLRNATTLNEALFNTAAANRKMPEMSAAGIRADLKGKVNARLLDALDSYTFNTALSGEDISLLYNGQDVWTIREKAPPKLTDPDEIEIRKRVYCNAIPYCWEAAVGNDVYYDEHPPVWESRENMDNVRLCHHVSNALSNLGWRQGTYPEVSDKAKLARDLEPFLYTVYVAGVQSLVFNTAASGQPMDLTRGATYVWICHTTVKNGRMVVASAHGEASLMTEEQFHQYLDKFPGLNYVPSGPPPTGR